MMNNVMMRNMMVENNVEDKTSEEEVKTEKIEKDTSDSLTSCLFPYVSLVLSMLTESNKETVEIKCLHEKIHDLDKRIAVCEALIKDKK